MQPNVRPALRSVPPTPFSMKHVSVAFAGENSPNTNALQPFFALLHMAQQSANVAHGASPTFLPLDMSVLFVGVHDESHVGGGGGGG